MTNRTCLYDAHMALKGKMVDFAGYDMPIQYEGIIQEHTATREAIGMFDVSHMGKFLVEGEGADAAINYLITNDISNMETGQAVYSPMCQDDGGTIDDILVYKKSDSHYMLVVNAANKEKDFDWIRQHLPSHLTLDDVTGGLCQIAVQGPKAVKLLNELTYEPIDDMKYYWFKDNIILADSDMLVSRTGYTGEDGYELYFDADDAVRIWELLLEKGQPYGLKPCGLGARDTLRFEAGMPLYGNELSSTINPYEAGLGYFIKLDKDEFIGKDALKSYKENPSRKLVGFELLDKGIARHGAEVVDQAGNVIGLVTTGYMSPTFGSTLGFALIPSDYIRNRLTIQVRKKTLDARIINKRFLKTYNKTEV